jgi:hypothetical protein
MLDVWILRKKINFLKFLGHVMRVTKRLLFFLAVFHHCRFFENRSTFRAAIFSELLAFGTATHVLGSWKVKLLHENSIYAVEPSSINWTYVSWILRRRIKAALIYRKIDQTIPFFTRSKLKADAKSKCTNLLHYWDWNVKSYYIL